jgi:hypothetical protein
MSFFFLVGSRKDKNMVFEPCTLLWEAVNMRNVGVSGSNGKCFWCLVEDEVMGSDDDFWEGNEREAARVIGC